MQRLLLLAAGVLLATSVALLASGCLDDMPMPAQHAITKLPSLRTPSLAMAPPKLVPVDLGTLTDLTPPPPPDLAPAGLPDLAGLIDCYGKAYCDATTMFCLRFFGGTPGQPQPEKVAPSCYAPNDPCANGTLDCNCIQQDAVLGPSCAECFANPDGTFTCYAK
jgi:hypothetical protein